MRHIGWLLALGLSALGCGCAGVDRRYVITSDPPGAVVLRNNQPIGVTPVDDHFVYYGTYHFTLIKDGYQTLQVDQKIAAPWFEYFPIDFFAETLWPFPIEDARRFHYKLELMQIPNLDNMLNRGQELRNRGKSIGPTVPEFPPPPPVPAPTNPT
jgi:hypothetical protein